ncbi:hypothetical protein HanRHA438_Chr08g0361101 [Helianthus annuus]|nr:hypothetical protein HanRHA438_Chr08g0361101 [Helianthus annuus]
MPRQKTKKDKTASQRRNCDFIIGLKLCYYLSTFLYCFFFFFFCNSVQSRSSWYMHYGSDSRSVGSDNRKQRSEQQKRSNLEGVTVGATENNFVYNP